MMSVSPKHRIFLAIQPLDFRNGISGIVKRCQYQYRLDPMSGHYFIFRNKRGTSLKILYYDAQGFCLFQKLLSSGRFRGWPKTQSELVTLTPVQLQVLLCNGDPEATRTAAPWHPLEEN